ncbi:MAG TPA: thioredoxin family protein [Ktedonobacterales bacterium]|nr:thioredoxin family protein [Ktedonobacterales bacterium]
MPVTRERFEQGLTYDEFTARMTRNQERFAASEAAVALDADDLAAFRRLPQALNVLVLAEDWCGDVIDNLPVLGRLAEASGKLNVRIFLRNANPDLMDQYLNQGQFRSIPVFAFFDEHFNALGHFIERPQSVTQARAARRAAIYAAHPEFGAPDTPVANLPEEARVRLTEALASARSEAKPAENAAVVRALRDIVEGARV